MPHHKNLEKELASAKDHIKRLEEHIKTLEEGGDCADVTETFWNIHNNEVYEMEKKHKKEIKALIRQMNNNDKANKKIVDEKECYELCFETFSNVDKIMEEEDIGYLINEIKEDIEKRWTMNGRHWSQSYYIDDTNIPHTFNILFPLALKIALNLYRNKSGIYDIPIDYNGDLEYYDEEGAYNHISELIDDYNEDNNEIIYYDEEEHPEATDLIELIDENLDYNERQLIYLPSVSQNGKRMIILMNLDGSL